MPDQAWQDLVESALTNIEPDAEKRKRLKARLRERDELGWLYAAWCSGCDATSVGRIVHRLAKELRY